MHHVDYVHCSRLVVVCCDFVPVHFIISYTLFACYTNSFLGTVLPNHIKPCWKPIDNPTFIQVYKVTPCVIYKCPMAVIQWPWLRVGVSGWKIRNYWRFRHQIIHTPYTWMGLMRCSSRNMGRIKIFVRKLCSNEGFVNFPVTFDTAKYLI